MSLCLLLRDCCLCVPAGLLVRPSWTECRTLLIGALMDHTGLVRDTADSASFSNVLRLSAQSLWRMAWQSCAKSARHLKAYGILLVFKSKKMSAYPHRVPFSSVLWAELEICKARLSSLSGVEKSQPHHQWWFQPFQQCWKLLSLSAFLNWRLLQPQLFLSQCSF